MEKRFAKYSTVTKILIIIGLITYIFGPVSPTSSTELVTTQETRFLMDTTVEIRGIGPESARVVEQAFREMERVEQLLSRYIPASEISTINANAGEWVRISQETFGLIEKAVYYSQLSNGSFDFTIGRLVTLWGFGTEDKRIPSEMEIESAVASVNFAKVKLDKENLSIMIPGDTLIDLGGIAKGYAVDQAAKVLRENSINSGLINAGGDILAIGTKPDGTEWRVGVQDPRKSTELLAVLPLKDLSVVTSGDYQRFFVAEGVRFHHIIDPNTGYPANGLTSVTVVAGEAADADALSTAIFVLDAEQGKRLVEDLDNIEAIIVDESGQVWVSSGLVDVIQLI